MKPEIFLHGKCCKWSDSALQEVKKVYYFNGKKQFLSQIIGHVLKLNDRSFVY